LVSPEPNDGRSTGLLHAYFCPACAGINYPDSRICKLLAYHPIDTMVPPLRADIGLKEKITTTIFSLIASTNTPHR